MGSINFFESMDHIQPKCPSCGVVVDFGTNTQYSEEHDAHVCECGHVLKENMDKEIKMSELPDDEP